MYVRTHESSIIFKVAMNNIFNEDVYIDEQIIHKVFFNINDFNSLKYTIKRKNSGKKLKAKTSEKNERNFRKMLDLC